MELIFASANNGKIKEVAEILEREITLKGLRDVGISEEIPETGNTFHQNAFLKANYVYQKTKSNCFADDSGLEVEALHNEPGVNSAYYAGLPRNDDNNIQLVLKKLSHQSNRKARFVCVICLIMNGTTQYFEGIVNGQISLQPRGHNGFGYDPIFIPDGYTQTFGELSHSIKNTLSHRYLALQKMKAFLINSPGLGI